MTSTPLLSLSLRLLLAAACAAAPSLLARSARADAVLLPVNPSAEVGPKGQWFPDRVNAEVTVRAQVESTTLDLDFGVVDQGGDFVVTVPGPHGAFIVDLLVDTGGGFVQAPIHVGAPPRPAGGAGQSDPAVAAWLGTTPLSATLSSLPAGPLKVRVKFQRLLRRAGGRVAFDVGLARCPLRPAGAPGPAVALRLGLRTWRSLDVLDVTGGTGTVVDRQDAGATVTWGAAALADEMVHVSYAEHTDGVKVSFLAHRTATADPLGGSAGYFLLAVDSDVVNVDDTEPRTLTVVVDRSGSMEGAKLAQARAAALAVVESTRDGDRLNVAAFDHDVTSLGCAPAPADAARRDEARAFVAGIVVGGATNLYAAATFGLGVGCPDAAAAMAGRHDVVVLLSDGFPTAGVTDRPTLLANVAAMNPFEARLFTVSIGAGADVALMEALARGSRGRNFVLTEAQAAADLTSTVAALAEDIRAVRVSGLSWQVEAVGPSDMLPEMTPDLYSGGQVLVVGRYGAPGPGTVRLTGTAGGSQREWTADVDAPANEPDNEFVKYVWATEKVAALIAASARDGTSHEDEITRLGLGYRIQTPYTSFSFRDEPGGGANAGGGGSGGSSGGGPIGPASERSAAGGCTCAMAGRGDRGATWWAGGLAVLLALRKRRGRAVSSTAPGRLGRTSASASASASMSTWP